MNTAGKRQLSGEFRAPGWVTWDVGRLAKQLALTAQSLEGVNTWLGSGKPSRKMG